MAIVFSIVGRSESGKTTLITKLVSEMKRRGISVSVIKHCPRGFDLDTEGKDSWRFKEAGADGVMVVSQERFGMVKDVNGALTVPHIVNTFLADVNLVLTEGYPDGTAGRKIEVLRSAIGREPLWAPTELTAIVSDFDVQLDLPRFGHEDVAGIVDFMEGFMKEDEGKRVELKVNGKDVGLNPFVQSIFTNTILGMVSSLRIEEEPRRVELSISSEGS